MASFTFFKNDGRCRFVRDTVIGEHFDKYLRNEEGIKYYFIVDWTTSGNSGPTMEFYEDYGVRYVKTIDDLPEGAGVYISTYDGDLDKIKELKEKGVPIVYDGLCPWAKGLRIQVQTAKEKYPDHRCVLLMNEKHILAENYRRFIPENAIFVNELDYKEKLKILKDGEPVYFIPYSTYRVKDSERIIQYIKEHYPHPESIYKVKNTICCWSKQQGIFEELEEKIKKEKLDEVWIICNNERNRSVKSIIAEIEEDGAKPVPIKEIEDIPEKADDDRKIGIFMAPVPYTKEVDILYAICDKHGIDKDQLDVSNYYKKGT